ncbi:hypothetical protein HDV00_005340 [Rhizophlyctis rosea]|nr:hypothetical protein HDV00_005340 [Rhizophlyctis rosea]
MPLQRFHLPVRTAKLIVWGVLTASWLAFVAYAIHRFATQDPVISTKYEFASHFTFVYPVILIWYQSVPPYSAGLGYSWSNPVDNQFQYMNETAARSSSEFFDITEQKVDCSALMGGQGTAAGAVTGECLLARLVPTAKLTPRAYSQLTLSGFAVATRQIQAYVLGSRWTDLKFPEYYVDPKDPDLLSLFKRVRSPQGPEVLLLLTGGGSNVDTLLTSQITQITYQHWGGVIGASKGPEEKFYSLYTSSSQLSPNISEPGNSPRTWLNVVQGPSFQHVQQEVPTMTIAEVINSIAAPWTVVAAIMALLFGMERIRTTGLVQRYVLHPNMWIHAPQQQQSTPEMVTYSGALHPPGVSIQRPEAKGHDDNEGIKARLERLEEFERLMRGHFVVIDHEKYRDQVITQRVVEGPSPPSVVESGVRMF